MKAQGSKGFIISFRVLDPKALGGFGFHIPPERGDMDPTRANGWFDRPERPEVANHFGPSAEGGENGVQVDTRGVDMSTQAQRSGVVA